MIILPSTTYDKQEKTMVNVLVALLCVAAVGGAGGLLHSIVVSDAPATAKKEEQDLKMGTSMVSVAVRPTSMARETLAGAASGLIFYGSTIAPATGLTLHAQSPLVLGSLAGIALVGLSGTDYLNRLVKERQWAKLDPAYDSATPQVQQMLRRGVTSPIIALRTLAGAQETS